MDTERNTKRALILSGIAAASLFSWSLVLVISDFFAYDIVRDLIEGDFLHGLLVLISNAHYSGGFNAEFASLLAVPVFLTVILLAAKGGLRARLVWLGFVAFFLHLNYLALGRFDEYDRFPFLIPFALLLFSLAFGLQALPTEKLEERFASSGPRKTISAFLLLEIVLIVMPIVFGIATGSGFVRYEKEITAIHFVNFPRFFWTDASLQLCVLAPLYIIAAVQLLRRKTWGYVLAAVLLVKDALPIFFVTPSYGSNAILPFPRTFYATPAKPISTARL